MDLGAGRSLADGEVGEMGTRADFWMHKNHPGGWLGSIAWDGYPDGIPAQVLSGGSLPEWRAAVRDLLAEREDGTTPDMGWPWPWEDSRTTDYAYVWDEGEVVVYCFGKLNTEDEEEYERREKEPFPDMTKLKDTTYGKRSGLITFGL